MEHVFARDSVLLQMICQLLNEEKLRVAAADCLLVLVERKRVKLFAFLMCIPYATLHSSFSAVPISRFKLNLKIMSLVFRSLTMK